MTNNNYLLREFSEHAETVELPEDAKILTVFNFKEDGKQMVYLDGEINETAIEILLTEFMKEQVVKERIRKLVLKDFMEETKKQYSPIIEMVSGVIASSFGKQPEPETEEETD